MPQFNIDAYLATKLASNAKEQEVIDASRAKILELQRPAQPAAPADASSWVNQLGLEPGSFLANRVNDAASLVSGATRLAGQVASLPVSAFGEDNTHLTSQFDVDAYNRHVAGKATPEDVARLGRRMLPTDPTVLEQFQRADASRATARKINDTLDLSGTVHQGNRTGLASDLALNFQPNWDKVKSGEAGQIISGVAGLLANAGSALAHNPSAVREYVLENAPQLFLGVYGKAGQAAMAASNIGYAVDEFQKGIEAYRAANGGQLPSVEQQRTMAVQAASLALAEEGGDLIGVAAMKSGEKVADTARKSFKDALLGRAGAVAEGVASEAPTEGYQTYMERKIEGKPDDALDVYTSAVIGGASGGVLSGAGHVAHEMVQPAAEKAQTAAPAPVVGKAVDDAHVSGDVTELADPQLKTYAPAKAIAALRGFSQRPEATEEEKAQSLAKATEIRTELEKRRNEMDEAVAVLSEDTTTDPKDLEAAKGHLKRLDAQLAEVDDAHEVLLSAIEPEAVVKKKVESLVADVEHADPKVSAPAAEQVINLAMASPDAVAPELAKKLVENTANGLTDTQREYLRQFTDARVEANKLRGLGDVSREILNGSNENLGIKQYRRDIAVALANGEHKQAVRKLDLLGAFARDHQAKAAAAKEAISLGLGNAIVRTDDGQWLVKEGTRLSESERSRNGGLNVKSGRLVESIVQEAKALAAAHVEMQAAFNNRFPKAPAATAAVATPAPQPAEAANVQNVSPEGVQPQPVAEAEKAAADGQAGTTGATKQPGAAPAAGKPAAGDDAQAAGVTAAASPVEKTEAVEKKSEEAQAAVAAPVEQSSTTSSEAQSTHSASPVGERLDQDHQAALEPAPADQAETVEKNPDPVEDSQAGGLSAIAQKSPEGTSYQSRNLVAEFFTQTAKKVGDATQRPLVAMKDFLTNITNDGVLKFVDLGKAGKLSKEQEGLLGLFNATAAEWFKSIDANLLVEDHDAVKYKDLSQHLLVDGKLEENVKTAMVYGAFSWVIENASRNSINDEDAIRSILGLSDGTPVDDRMKSALAHAGQRQAAVINTLGQRAVGALGLKAGKKAPQDLQARLESAVGALMYKMLLDQGLVTRKQIDGQTMRDLTGSEKTSLVSDHNFVTITRGKDGALHPAVRDIAQASRKTSAILDRLFGVEPALKEPKFEPIPFDQKTTKNTRQGVPSKLAKIIEHENSVPSYVKQELYKLVKVLPDAVMLKIAGAESTEGRHASKELSIKATNEGLERELRNFKDFVDGMEKADAPLYFDHVVWKQQRVGIATNMINPQTSKLHRHLLVRKAWESSIDLGNQDQTNNFYLRVGEGLGVKTDKQANSVSLERGNEKSVWAKIESPEIEAAVKVLVDFRNGAEMTTAMQDTLVAGVAKGGENMHTLDALMALADLAIAVEKGDTKFTTQLMGEIDGVTNGPMLSHLLLGAASSVKELFGLLNRGGFFSKADDFSQYNQYRGTTGNRDLYENTTRSVLDKVRELLETDNGYGAKVIKQASLDSVYAFTGRLENQDDSITKEGRDIIKTPLTAMVFGSSIPKAIDSMANNFVESIYDAIEKSAAGEKDALSQAELVKHINKLFQAGYTKNEDKGIEISAAPLHESEDLMQHTFEPNEVAVLKEAFKRTLGRAVKATIEAEFAPFIERRAKINFTAESVFKLYNAVYTAMREQKIQQLMEAGELAYTLVAPRDANGKPIPKAERTVKRPIQDLSAEQEAQIRKELEAIAPMMHTPMSKASKELAAGLRIAKSDRELNDAPQYDSHIKFAQGIKGSGKFSTKLKQTVEESSVHVPGFSITETSPGVAMLVMGVHSADSAVSHTVANPGDSLNIHDARGTGVDQFQDVGTNLNHSTWNVMLDYSPAREMHDALLRTVNGLSTVLTSKDLPAGAQVNLQQALTELSNTYNKRFSAETNTGNIIEELVKTAEQTAYLADHTKLEAMEQMAFIDQYALEGGHYQVTDKDRTEAAARRAKLPQGVDAKDLASIKIINEKLGTAEKQEAQEEKADTALVEELDGNTTGTSAFGPLGQSSIESDADLVKFFEQNPKVKAERVIAGLYRKFKNDTSIPNGAFNLQLLQRLQTLVGKDVTITYVTPKTDPDTVARSSTEAARGWYVKDGIGEEIYVLSPDFVNSGLTPEVLLHELTHAALAGLIASPTAEAKELIDDLERLREKAKAHDKAGAFAAATSDIQEFVAWGMTNKAFQDQVLSQISMQSKTRKTDLVTGMKEFIKTLVSLVFAGSNKSTQAITVNGMTTMVNNVAGLMAAAEKKSSTGNLNLAMASAALSTIDIHEALASTSNGNVSAGFSNHLRGLLNGIVKELHGPFGTFKASVQQQLQGTPVDAWIRNGGVAPFSSAALASGFRVTDQEAFVLEQVEATVKSAIDANETHTKMAYRELSELYLEVYRKLKVQDFYAGDWASATQAQRDEAQNIYDFVFKMEKNNGNRSDYLARFAAMGLAHEGFNKLLQVATERDGKKLADAKTFAERLQVLFENILGFFGRKLTRTYDGQPADSKLKDLVTQLVEIEAKQRDKFAAPTVDDRMLAALEEGAKDVANYVKDKVVTAANSQFVQRSGNAFLKGAAGAVRIVSAGHVPTVVQAISDMRDRVREDRLGVVSGIINEIRGPRERFERLLRARKIQEGERKDIITGVSKTVLRAFKDDGKGLTKEVNAALSQTLLRTGAHVLLDQGFDLAKLESVLGSRAELQKAIIQLQGQLDSTYSDAWIRAAKDLAHYKVTGINRSPLLRTNAYLIARLAGVAHQVNEDTATQAEGKLEALVALYGLQYSGAAAVSATRDVLRTELQRKDGGNGVEFVLKLHKSLQEESQARLFSGNKALMLHGYTPEVYNPHREVQVANEIEGRDLIAQGYVKGAQVALDPADPYQEVRHLYLMKDGGLPPWLSGIMSMTGMQAKGSKVHSGYLNPLHQAGVENASTNAAFLSQRLANLGGGQATTYDPSRARAEYAAPIYNENGEIVNWRYLMHESTKDTLLDRDNRIEKLLGTLAGSVFDKTTAGEVNKLALEAAKEEFDAEYSRHPERFVKIAPDVADTEMRQIWDLMPVKTKEMVRNVWGKEHMYVRRDTLDIMFGYRKLSLADAFEKDPAVRNAVERVFTQSMEMIFGDRAALRVRQGERAWQEIMKEAKDNIVVKTGTVLLGNIWSNLSLLWINGVPLKDMVHHHLVALKGASAWLKDSDELRQLKIQRDAGYTQGRAAEIERDIVRLEDALARNPVRSLIEAGLMPSIVEDVEASEDIYSYKSQLTRKVDAVTGKVPTGLTAVARSLYMAHDTAGYKAMSRATQLSDFVARYVLYQHLTTRKDEKLSHEDAIQQASDSFVNYDIPSHRLMQYANDMGIFTFTKYFLRIQRVLQKASMENPLRYYTLVALHHFMSVGPIVLDSHLLAHVGNNPVRAGALIYPSSLSNLATVDAAMKLVK